MPRTHIEAGPSKWEGAILLSMAGVSAGDYGVLIRREGLPRNFGEPRSDQVPVLRVVSQLRPSRLLGRKDVVM